MRENKCVADSLYKLKNVDNYNRWIYDNIDGFTGKRVLEIGCGIGNITDYLILKHRNVTGIDISKNYVKFAAGKYRGMKNVRIRHADIFSYRAKSKFDSAVMLNVLEHIKDDGKAVEKINALLKKNGRIIIFVPAMNLIYGTLDSEMKHYRRYDRKQLKQLLESRGFETERIYYMNFVGAFAWFLNGRVLKRKKISMRQAGIFDRMFVPWIRAAETAIKPPFGQSLVAVARKV